MPSNDLTKDFVAPGGIEKNTAFTSYFQAMEEAKEAMYDYLIAEIKLLASWKIMNRQGYQEFSYES